MLIYLGLSHVTYPRGYTHTHIYTRPHRENTHRYIVLRCSVAKETIDRNEIKKNTPKLSLRFTINEDRCRVNQSKEL